MTPDLDLCIIWITESEAVLMESSNFSFCFYQINFVLILVGRNLLTYPSEVTLFRVENFDLEKVANLESMVRFHCTSFGHVTVMRTFCSVFFSASCD